MGETFVNGRRTDTWRGAFIALLTAIVTLFGGWMSVGGKLISRDELNTQVSEQVKLYSAEHDEYGKAKQSIDDRLTRADQLGAALTSVLTEQAKTNVKLDAILERLKTLEDRYITGNKAPH
jgi:uncharacterized coiled-coil protein SlyX